MKPFSLDRNDLQRDFLEKKIQTFHLNLAEQAKTLPDSLFTALHTLQRIRMGFGEDMNQLFHVAAIVSAYNELVKMKKSYADLEWKWNPTQQGRGDEPDLRGSKKNQVMVSAEVKTAHDAEGATRTNLKNACLKLNDMEGDRFLFVANKTVANFVQPFVDREGLGIKVVSLNINPVHESEKGRLHRDI